MARVRFWRERRRSPHSERPVPRFRDSILIEHAGIHIGPTGPPLRFSSDRVIPPSYSQVKVEVAKSAVADKLEEAQGS